MLREVEIELEPLRHGDRPINYDQLDADLDHLLSDTGMQSDAETSYSESKPNHSTKGQSSVAKAAFNMTKTIVGAGVFGLPAVFRKAGFFTVVLLIVVMAFYINWTLQVLLRAGLQAKVDSYHDLMFKCFGRRGAQMYAVFAFLFAFGGMCAYTVIIGDTVPGVLRAMFGVASSDSKLSPFLNFITDRRVVIALTSYLIIFPVSSVRNISALAKFSIFALVAIIMIALIVPISGSMLDSSSRGSSNSEIFTILKPEGLSAAIGTLCFAYVCHHNTFIIFKSLKFPTIKNFDMVNLFSLGYACLCSLFIGITGYVIFNDKVLPNILNCFPPTDTLINFARALFALDMFLTYPLELFIARNTLYKSGLGLDSDMISYTLHMATTILLITLTTIIGLSTCNVGAVFDLTGGVAASAIAFIFPSACTIKLQAGRILVPENVAHLLSISFGCFVLLLTTVTTLVEIFEQHGDSTANVCKNMNL